MISDDLCDERWKELAASAPKNGPTQWDAAKQIRALRVVHFLVSDGAEAKSLSAAGYSEIDPIAANTTPEGRKQNRRTEITLQPNIDELVNVP